MFDRTAILFSEQPSNYTNTLCFDVFPSVFVHCNSGLRHIVIPFSVLINEHWVHGREEHRMPPFLDVFPTRDQS